jgi:hypothetical protein
VLFVGVLGGFFRGCVEEGREVQGDNWRNNVAV